MATATVATATVDAGRQLLLDRVGTARDAVKALESAYPEAFAALRADTRLRQVGHNIRSRMLMNSDVVLSSGLD